ATLQTATWHHHRYQMPAYSALVLLGSVGVVWLTSSLPRLLRGLVVFTLTVAWSSYSVADFGNAYRHDLDTIAQMQRPLADWLRTHTPAEARIAVHDVGVMRFIGQRNTLDVVGLTSPGMAETYRHGPGALYEALRREQPDYFALYPDTAPPYFGLAQAAELLGEELFRVTMPDYSPYVSAGATQIVTRADWSEAPLADQPQQPDIVSRLATLARTDSLNVADLGDERAHSFEWWMVENLPGFVSDARRMAYRTAPALRLPDGGRSVDGGYGFRLTAQPGEPLLLVARLHQIENLRMHVRVNGLEAGEWRLPAIPGEWLESAFQIPAELITADRANIMLTAQPDDVGTRFDLFYVWAYAGDAIMHVEPPTFPLNATLGEVADLIGYDLPRTDFSPGETISLALHWRSFISIKPRTVTPADWRIFVHLTDRRNDTASGILTQWDAAPAEGTYPFWVWGMGELRRESVMLTVPVDAQPGDYALLVGIFDSATGVRALVTSEAAYSGDRVWLTTITVRSP
ncbi:MAG: hypothetical protein ACT4QE_05780, partial [Anaerolineales bacterium]